MRSITRADVHRAQQQRRARTLEHLRAHHPALLAGLRKLEKSDPALARACFGAADRFREGGAKPELWTELHGVVEQRTADPDEPAPQPAAEA